MKADSSPTPVRLPHRRTDVFISYSHKDKKWLDQLHIMLKPSVRMSAITIWDDTQIKSGAKWYDEINKALDTARVAVLLVSPAFLASDFIAKHELPQLEKAAEQEGLTILWVAVKQSMYEDTVIAKYQATNNPDRPLSILSSAKRDEELKKICRQIKQTAAFDKAFEITPPRAVPTGPDTSAPPESTNSKPIQSVPLEKLVDFEKQQDFFLGMLNHSSEKRLMFVRAPSGFGKTSLLRMMRFHCEKKGAPWCWIDFHGKPYDNCHFTLALEICNQLGFLPRQVAQVVKPFSTYKPEGKAFNSHVVAQILAGVSLSHEALRQHHIKERLIDAFITDLGRFAKKEGRVVCLFDSFEYISAEEEEWLLDTLLFPVKRDDLKSVLIVTSGYSWPKGIKKAEWKEYAHLINGLPCMSVENLRIYAQKVGVKLTHKEAEDCWNKSFGGNPLIMSTEVEVWRGSAEVKP